MERDVSDWLLLNLNFVAMVQICPITNRCMVYSTYNAEPMVVSAAHGNAIRYAIETTERLDGRIPQELVFGSGGERFRLTRSAGGSVFLTRPDVIDVSLGASGEQ